MLFSNQTAAAGLGVLLAIVLVWLALGGIWNILRGLLMMVGLA